MLCKDCNFLCWKIVDIFVVYVSLRARLIIKLVIFVVCRQLDLDIDTSSHIMERFPTQIEICMLIRLLISEEHVGGFCMLLGQV